MSNHKSHNTNINPQNDFQYQKNDVHKGQKKSPPKKISETYLHNSGLYYLERFAASKKHFKFIMMRKVKRSCLHHTDQNYEECAKMVDALTDKFDRIGLLNDALYTNSLITSLRRKGLSRSAIISKMTIKGISRDETLLSLENLDKEQYENLEEAERQSALRLAKRKKIGPFFSGKEQNIKKSLGIFARAGFSYNIAKSILELKIDKMADFTNTNTTT